MIARYLIGILMMLGCGHVYGQAQLPAVMDSAAQTHRYDFAPYTEPVALAPTADQTGFWLLANVSPDTSGPERDILLARLQANGARDSSFGQNGTRRLDLPGLAYSIAADLAVLPSGKLLVLGSGHDPALPSEWHVHLMRLRQDGKRDTAFADSGAVRMRFVSSIAPGSEEWPTALHLNGAQWTVVGYGNERSHDETGVPMAFLGRGDTTGALAPALGGTGLMVMELPFGTVPINPGKTAHTEGTKLFDGLQLANGATLLCGGRANGINSTVLFAKLKPDGRMDPSFSNNGYTTRNLTLQYNSQAVQMLQLNDSTVLSALQHEKQSQASGFLLGRLNPQTAQLARDTLRFANDRHHRLRRMVRVDSGLFLVGTGKPTLDQPQPDTADWALAWLPKLEEPGSYQTLDWDWPGLQNGSASMVAYADSGAIAIAGVLAGEQPGQQAVGIVAFDKRALNNKGGRPGPPPEEPITDVRIGPNPTATTLQLKYPTEDQKRYRLRLVNVNGQAVLSRRLANDGTDQLNMRPLEVGVYYLQLIENGAVIAERKIMRP